MNSNYYNSSQNFQDKQNMDSQISIMAMDEDEFDPDEENLIESDFSFSNFIELKEHPVHVCVFLQFVMTYYKQPYSLLFWLSTTNVKLSGPREYKRWAEEVYHMFISFTSPCYVLFPLEIESDILEPSKNKIFVNYNHPSIFDEMRSSVENELNAMVTDYLNKKSIGMIPFLISVDKNDFKTFESEKKKSFEILTNLIRKYTIESLTLSNKKDVEKANCLLFAIRHYMGHLGYSLTEIDSLVTPLVESLSGFKDKKIRQRTQKKESKSENNLVSRSESLSRLKKFIKGDNEEPRNSGSQSVFFDSDIDLQRSPKNTLVKTPTNDLESTIKTTIVKRKQNRRDTLFTFGEAPSDLYDENDTEFFNNLDLNVIENLNWCETISKDFRASLSNHDIDRQEAIFELVNTEKNYVKFLIILHKIFMLRMISEDMISIIHSNFLFSNLPEILEKHIPFLNKLVDLVKLSPVVQNLSHILIDHFGGENGESLKKMYASCCALQNIGIDSLKERRKYDNRLNHFMKMAESLNICKRLTFNEIHACLYQRITKYPLLFDTIRRKTPSDHPDYIGMVKAVELSKSLLTYSNKVKQEVENLQRLYVLNKQIVWKYEGTGNQIEQDKYVEIRNFRYLKDCVLVWNRAKSVFDVQLVFFDKCMFMFVKKNEKLYPIDSITGEGKVGMLSYDHMIVRENAADEKEFFLLIDSGSFNFAPVIYQLSASSKLERKMWIEYINHVVVSYKNGSLQKDVVDLSFIYKDNLTGFASGSPSKGQDEPCTSPGSPIIRSISMLKSQKYVSVDSSKAVSKYPSQIFFPE